MFIPDETGTLFGYMLRQQYTKTHFEGHLIFDFCWLEHKIVFVFTGTADHFSGSYMFLHTCHMFLAPHGHLHLPNQDAKSG